MLPEKINSENAEAVREELLLIYDGEQADNIVLNAENMTYISSAGLRALMSIHKEHGNVTITDMSNGIYEIFETTGFNTLFHISRKRRRISIEGAKRIGSGKNGMVYRIDDDMIVKVYRNRCDVDDITEEKELAKWAFLAGIPTAISFDIVQVGDLLGTVYELISAKSISELIHEDPDNMHSYMKQYVEFMKQIHSIEADVERLPDCKESYRQIFEYIRSVISDSQYKQLNDIIESIPDATTVLHGDIHPGNVMKTKDDIVVIDMDSLGYGNPVFDLAELYSTLIGFSKISKEDVVHLGSMQIYPTIWQTTLDLYFDGEDEGKVERIRNVISALGTTRVIKYSIKHGVDGDGFDSLLADLTRYLYNIS